MQSIPDVPAHPAAEVIELPALPKMPAPITKLVLAQPFVMQQPFVSEYRAEGETVAQGWLLVIHAPLPLLVPRQAHEPVVQVGQSLPIRVNHGKSSGYTVVIAPARRGQVRADTRAWLNSVDLPERMDDAALDAALAQAEAAGIHPIGKAEAEQALSRGTEWLKGIARHAPAGSATIKDRTELVALAHRLVASWAPSEVPEHAAP